MSDQVMSDSAVAANDSEDRVLLALEQLLEQCDDDNVPALVKQVKTKLAQRHYALNAHQCRLLDLPPELLERIGEFVLKSWRTPPSKYWFTQGIFPLLQTCSQLRTQLDTLRSTPVTCYITTDRPWSGVMRAVKKWRRKGFHKGPTTIVVATQSMQYRPSTTAALAGALECAIYGGLSEPPAVYIGLKVTFGTTKREQSRKFYVSHGRAENMLVASYRSEQLNIASGSVSREEGTEIWEQARKKTEDQAP